MERRSRGIPLPLLLVLGLLAGCDDGLPEEMRSPLVQMRENPKLKDQLFRERQDERDKLVDEVIAKATEIPIDDKRVVAAMRKVPRHAFLTLKYLVEKRAYIDRPLSIGYGFQTISQPSIVAAMMQLLQVKDGQKVLEIGTGSGYQAALLAELTPHVHSIEIIKPLAAEGTERLQRLGYATIKTRAGDGYYGWPEAAPFDAIIVTCAAGHVPPPLTQQLAPGGRMVIPVGNPHQVQRLLLVTKDAKGELTTEDKMPVRFVPMTGSAGRTGS